MLDLRSRVELAVVRVMHESPDSVPTETESAIVEAVMAAVAGCPELVAQIGAAVHMNRELPRPAELTALRERFGLFQQQVAEIVGVSPAAVSKWESGACAPMRGTRERARYLNLVDLMIREVGTVHV